MGPQDSVLEVLVPSRARPQSIERLLSAWHRTVELPSTHLTVGVDDDDPCLDEYRQLARADGSFDLIVSPPLGLAPFTNKLAQAVATRADVVGSIGDDHVPSTRGWDVIVCRALEAHPGVAYVNDLYRRRELATAGFISAEIIRRLGYVCPPTLVHYYIDDFWMTLGRATRLTYLPHVVIEHLHPDIGKASRDETYTRAEHNLGMERDRVAFDAFLATQWPTDREQLKDLRPAAAPNGIEAITSELAAHVRLAMDEARFQDAYDIVLSELAQVVDAELLNDLGVLAFQAGDLNGARSWLAAALAVQPELASARQNLGAIPQ